MILPVEVHLSIRKLRSIPLHGPSYNRANYTAGRKARAMGKGTIKK